MMNKLSGYTEIQLPTGETIGLKFCNGSTELFARRMGFTLHVEIDQALNNPLPAKSLKARRLYVFCAAEYVRLVNDQPTRFNEWQAGEWLEQHGIKTLFSAVEAYSAPPTEKPQGQAEEDTQTLAQYKFAALSRLGIAPSVYYDLTFAETTALLKGVNDRDLFMLKQTRKIATLLRNAHFEKSVTEAEFMPLPGDRIKPKTTYMPPKVWLEILADMFPDMTRTQIVN